MGWINRIAALASVLISLNQVAGAAGCDAPANITSGSRTATVVELYTSEGCDSCPPADKWFSALNYRQHTVVPLAFHVDYWDYIGWKDRFASPAFAERQRDTVRRQGSRTVYTPQVMLDGRDLRAWAQASRFEAGVKEIAARTPRARLALQLQPGNAAVTIALTASLTDVRAQTDADIFVAVTEDNLVSRVTAGENRGATLSHNHVVRTLLGPFPLDAGNAGGTVINRTILLAREWKVPDLALAAFVQDRRSGEILQALSTPVCR